jgi:hypothetical protein
MLPGDLPGIQCSARQGLHQVFGLLECGFRRQRRFIRVNRGFDPGRAPCGQCLAQNGGALRGIAQGIAGDAACARDYGEIDGMQVAPELRVTKEGDLFPLDLAEAVSFLITTTFTFNPYFAQVASSPMTVVSPPSLTNAATWRSGNASAAAIA